ncbi:hypothetical protein ACVWWK_006338 [Bradyrhizobium sp. LB9.1b]
MLHALAAEETTRDVWWLHGTRDGRKHAFAAEARELLSGLAHHHSHVCYSAPDPGDRLNVEFDTAGHLDARLLQSLSVPRDGDFYLCGPAAFMSDLKAGLTTLGVAPDRIHTELFGAGPSLTPGIASSPQKRAHSPAGAPGPGPMVSFVRSGLNVCWGPAYASLPGAGRSLRRPRALVVPDRRLPQLRERTDRGSGQLRAGSTRPASGGQRPDLLLAAPK